MPLATIIPPANPHIILPKVPSSSFGQVKKLIAFAMKVSLFSVVIIVMIGLVKWVYDFFFNDFPKPYTPDNYPLSRPLYDDLRNKYFVTYKLQEGEIPKNLSKNFFKTTCNDIFKNWPEKFKKDLKEKAKIEENCNLIQSNVQLCPITGKKPIFPVRIGSIVYEAAVIFLYAQITGKDYVTDQPLDCNSIVIVKKLFSEIHPELSKQYESRISKIINFLKRIF